MDPVYVGEVRGRVFRAGIPQEGFRLSVPEAVVPDVGFVGVYPGMGKKLSRSFMIVLVVR